MNKKAQLDLIDGMELNWAAAAMGLAGGALAFWYVGYLGTGSGFGTKLITGVLGAVCSYFVSLYIFNK